MNLLEDAVGKPDLLFIRGQRDAVAGAAMGDVRTGVRVPFRFPVHAGHLDCLDDLSGRYVSNQKAQEVVVVGVDPGRILVEHEDAHIVGEGGWS